MNKAFGAIGFAAAMLLATEAKAIMLAPGPEEPRQAPVPVACQIEEWSYIPWQDAYWGGTYTTIQGVAHSQATGATNLDLRVYSRGVLVGLTHALVGEGTGFFRAQISGAWSDVQVRYSCRTARTIHDF